MIFPYEECIIRTYGVVIRVSPIVDPDADYYFGEYSTLEKTEKAMRLLHKAYSGSPVILNNVSVTPKEEDMLKEMIKDPFITNLPVELSRVEYFNKTVFQFPKEEDL